MTETAQPRLFRLSPLNQRRWSNFKANRRGYISLWVFMVLFILSLFAEFIANDKPIIASVDGKLLFPIFQTLSENDIVEPDDEFNLAVADFRDPFIGDYIDENGWAIWPPIRYSYRTTVLEIPEPAPSKPSWLYTREERCVQFPQGADDKACRLVKLELAWYRRPGARRVGTSDIWLSHFCPFRPHPHCGFGGDWCQRWCRSRLFRRSY